MNELVDTAQAEGRNLTRAEQAKYEAAERQLEESAGTLDIAERHAQYDRTLGQVDNPDRVPGMGGTRSVPSGENPYLAPEHRMADWVKADPSRVGNSPTDLDMDKYFRGMLTGNWAGADAERRVMSEGTNGAGGYTVPTVTSAQLIDLARNQTRVIQAGAQTIPISTLVTNVPRQTADPTASWVSENTQSSATDVTFDQVQFTARTLRFLVLTSRELVEDSVTNIGQLVSRVIAKSAALEIDRASLRGSGTAPEPKGILNQSGITSSSLGTNGAVPTWDTQAALALSVRSANFEPTAFIHHTRTESKLALQKDTQARYLTPPVNLEGVPRLTTNSIPINLTVGTGTTCSEVYCGDFSQLLIGMRADLTLQTLDQRYADYNQVGFFAYLRADVQLAHPLAFAVNTGVL
jgi:HK97 family phage major capsid protein